MLMVLRARGNPETLRRDSRRRGRTNPRVSGYRWSELESLPTSSEEQPLLSYGAAVSARPPPGSCTNIQSSWTTSLLWSSDSGTQIALWKRKEADRSAARSGIQEGAARIAADGPTRLIMVRALLRLLNPGVEGLDHLVDRIRHPLDAGPVVRVVPLRLNLFVGLAFLLDPRVVLQVVDPLPLLVAEYLDVGDSLPQQVLPVGGGSVELRELAAFFVELLEP